MYQQIKIIVLLLHYTNKIINTSANKIVSYMTEGRWQKKCAMLEILMLNRGNNTKALPREEGPDNNKKLLCESCVQRSHPNVPKNVFWRQ